MRYLITVSLLNSWLYALNAYEGYEDAAYEDFLRSLRRERSAPNAAMQTGIDFESDVEVAAMEPIIKERLDDPVYKVAAMVKGGVTQAALHVTREIDGIEFLLYGRLDWLRAGVISDIKRVNTSGKSPYQVGKYVSNIQHPFYFVICPGASRFDYLIFDGKEVFVETYTRTTLLQPAEDWVDTTIKEFMAFLKERGLLELYFEKWEARN